MEGVRVASPVILFHTPFMEDTERTVMVDSIYNK